MKRSDPVFDTVQSFFTDYLKRTRGCSPRTLEEVTRDTLRLFFDYAASALGTTVDRLQLTAFDADLLLAFLEHLEWKVRHNRIFHSQLPSRRVAQFLRPPHFASIQSTLDSWLGFMRYQANVIHRHHLGISIHRSSKRCF